MRHLLSVSDLTTAEVERIFAISADLKQSLQGGERPPLLAGHMLGLLFEKQSLRTRVSFETGMTHLGGASMMLGEDVGFGKRESLADFTRVLSAMVDIAAVRARSHDTVADMTSYANCPIINALTDREHPCQALADLFTLHERLGDLRGQKIAWVGDSNNVALSVALACHRTGMKMTLAAPAGYDFDEASRKTLARHAEGLAIEFTRDARAAVEGAAAVYTDVWASMGQESERAQRRKDFAAYQVNAELMAAAPAGAVFMHCLPARRGEEVADEVIDSPASVVIEQAANRMHVQKGILVWLLEQ